MSRNYGSENAPRDLLGVIATLDDGTVLHRSKLGSYMNRPEWSMLSREGRLDLLVPVSARV